MRQISFKRAFRFVKQKWWYKKIALPVIVLFAITMPVTQYIQQAQKYYRLLKNGITTTAVLDKNPEQGNLTYSYHFKDSDSVEQAITLKMPNHVPKSIKIIYNSQDIAERDQLERFKHSNPAYNWIFFLVIYPVFLFFFCNGFLIAFATFGMTKEHFEKKEKEAGLSS